MADCGNRPSLRMLRNTLTQNSKLRCPAHLPLSSKPLAQSRRINGRCRASPTDPGVAASRQHLHAPVLLPLDGQTVPPDPTVIALEQPATAALTYALREILLHVALPLLALWLLQRWLGHIEKRTQEEAEEGSGVAGGRGAAATLPLFRQLGHLLPVAATAPSRTALVLLTATHVARSVANIVQGLAERALLAAGGPAPDDLHRLLERDHAGRVLHSFKAALIRLDQGLIVFYQVALVVFGCWAVLSWKDVAVGRFLAHRQETSQGRLELERVLTPLNTFATWAIVAVAGVLVVQLLGVDVRPLLLVTGWSSVVAGLASQQLLTNAVSGVQMYLDRPFQVGDTISVMSGITSYVGEVVEVAALRTHLALEDGSTVAIPNRALTDMIITNRSRNSRRLNRPPWYHSRAPLSMQLRLRLRPGDYGGALAGELDELRGLVVGSGAVEEEGPLAPRLEVLGYSDRGVEVMVRCRLRNPAKLASSAASGDLAAATPPLALQLAGGGGHVGPSGGANGSGGVSAPAHGGNGTGRAEEPGPAASVSSRGGGGSLRALAGSSRDDALRLLRQQLLLALGPWLHARNGTLMVE
ncbi:hypothetical protein PLESTM_001448200 [Pleodorina starrii]|nr:hypothetical protein PLESTM_001448200 [Pleodorina starrii]